MTRLALALALIFGLLFALGLVLFSGTAWAAGDATGPALDEPQGRPVVMVRDVLLRVQPGDDMGAVIGAFLAVADDADRTPPAGGWCSTFNPCCPGCGLDGETTPPQPAQVPLPISGTLLLGTLGALALLGWIKR